MSYWLQRGNLRFLAAAIPDPELVGARALGCSGIIRQTRKN